MGILFFMYKILIENEYASLFYHKFPFQVTLWRWLLLMPICWVNIRFILLCFLIVGVDEILTIRTRQKRRRGKCYAASPKIISIWISLKNNLLEVTWINGGFCSIDSVDFEHRHMCVFISLSWEKYADIHTYPHKNWIVWMRTAHWIGSTRKRTKNMLKKIQERKYQMRANSFTFYMGRTMMSTKWRYEKFK